MKSNIFLGTKRRFPAAGFLLITFLLGGIGYGLLEVIWRGYTHPSMIFTGGFCLVVIWFLNRRMLQTPLLFRCLLCTAFVTATEFFVGLLVNRILHLHVWDYSASKFNLLGQICLEFSLIWFLICFLLSLGMTIAFRREKI